MSIFRGRQGAAPPDKARPERLDLIVFSGQTAPEPATTNEPTLDEPQTNGSVDEALTNGTLDVAPSAADPRAAQAAYDELVAKLRGGPVVDLSPTPRRRRWPWQRQKQRAAYMTATERLEVKRLADAARKEARQEKEAAEGAARAAKEARKRARDEERRLGRIASADAARAKEEARRAGPAARAELKLAEKAARAAAQEAKEAERAAAREAQRAARAAAREAEVASKAAKAEEKRAARLASAERKEAARTAKQQAKLADQAARASAKEAKKAAALLAKAKEQERRAAAAADRKARRAAGERGPRFARVRAILAWESGGGKKDVAGGGTWIERNFASLQKVKRIDLIIFSRQMATFIRAGIPITDGIRVVREQTRSSLFRRTLDEVTALLESGEPLSAALAQHPRVFPELYIDMVVAAEATGELDAILDQLAKYMERSDATSRQMKQAMLYPTIVLGLAAVVVFILMVVVLPAFVALFADFDAVLPLPTQILLSLGDFGGHYGIATGGIVVMLLTLLFLVRNTGPLKRLRQRIALRVPVLGTIIKLGIETRFARTLSILHKAGVPIAQSFEIAATGTSNDVYQKRLGPVREALIAGEGISTPLSASRLFGPLLVQMVKVGEETGTLDRYLDEAANFLDDELAYRTKQMVTIIEPLMILGVAGVVGFVALSVITPMYSILQQIK